ncbi:MAG: Y-family DNA polymerase [Fimbriiglobus sp.]
MPLRYLFIDMNAFFPSVEQQDCPAIRGRPVVVVPSLVNTASCIAVNYAARRAGVAVGDPCWKARQMCPGVVVRESRPDRYVEVHHEIVRAVGECIPVTRVMSIDEMACRLLGDEGRPGRAGGVAHAIKARIRRRFDFLTCSIGAGPNVMLAKVAGGMLKPDGFTIIDPADLPGRLYRLKLTDFPGIGPRMARRFERFNVTDVERLCGLSPAQMCHIWGSRVHGWRWWYLLRGEDVPEKPTKRRTVGHSHVLPPRLRTDHGGRGVMFRLVHKAAARLRRMDYWAGGLVVSADYAGGGSWYEARTLAHAQDTLTLLRAVGDLWDRRDPGTPTRVAVTLTDLVPARAATPSLFDGDQRLVTLCHVMDRVNRVFGPNAVYFGAVHDTRDDAPMRISFSNIPTPDPAIHGTFGGRYGLGALAH